MKNIYDELPDDAVIILLNDRTDPGRGCHAKDILAEIEPLTQQAIRRGIPQECCPWANLSQEK